LVNYVLSLLHIEHADDIALEIGLDVPLQQVTIETDL